MASETWSRFRRSLSVRIIESLGVAISWRDGFQSNDRGVRSKISLAATGSATRCGTSWRHGHSKRIVDADQDAPAPQYFCPNRWTRAYWPRTHKIARQSVLVVPIGCRITIRAIREPWRESAIFTTAYSR